MDGNEDMLNEPCPLDWRSLATRATVENDPEKLVNLVYQIERLLAEQQQDFSDWSCHENRSREWYSN